MSEYSTQKIERQRQYENKIMQFMPKKQTKNQENVQSVKQPKYTHRSKDVQTNDANNNQFNDKINNKHQNTPQIRSKQPSILRRKTTLYQNIHNSNSIVNNNSTQNNPQHSITSHKTLLEKIQTKIKLINGKISEQISKQQTSLLNQYEQKLRSKQELLNRLRMITNEEMIRQKTIQRREQLQREKQNLIQGNMYYHLRLQSIKNELSKLLQSKQAFRHTLGMLLAENNNSSDENTNFFQSKQTKQMTEFQESLIKETDQKTNEFNKLDNYNRQFVQKVLSNYNQIKTPSQQKKSRVQHLQNSRLKQLQNSMIKSKRMTKSTAVVTNSTNDRSGNDNIEMYSYRRVKNKTQRVKSIGVFENSVSGLKNTQIEKQIERQQQRQKDIDNNKASNNERKAPAILYSKKELQQFVVRKTNQIKNESAINQSLPSIEQSKRAYNKQNKNRSDRRKQQVNREKQKQLQLMKKLIKQIQALQGKLRIQQLFEETVADYYCVRQQQKEGNGYNQNILEGRNDESRGNGNGELILVEEQQQEKQQYQGSRRQQQKVMVKHLQSHQDKYKQQDYKRGMNILESNEFDKRTVIDCMLQSIQFKRYLYDMMVAQFQSNKQSELYENIQTVISKFSLSHLG